MKDLEKELDLLILNCEDKSITEEELKRLEQLLEENEQLRKRFIRQQMLSANLFADSELLVLPSKVEKKKPVNFIKPILLAAAALIAIAGVIYYGQEPTQVQMVATFADFEDENDTVIVFRKGKEIAITKNMKLAVNDKIMTTTKEVHLHYDGEETVVIIRDESILELKQVNGAKRLYLQKGDILCDVDKQPAGKPMIITTEQAQFTVLGTQFSLSTSKEQTSLVVAEGSVKMKSINTKEEVTVEAGWQVKASPGNVKKSPIDYSNSLIKVKKLILVDPVTEETIPGFESLQDGAVIDLSKIESEYLNIYIDAEEKYVDGVFLEILFFNVQIGKFVRFYPRSGGSKNRVYHRKYFHPYFVFGDARDGIQDKTLPWTPIPGQYRVTITPHGYLNAPFNRPKAVHKGRNTLGQSYTIDFTIK